MAAASKSTRAIAALRQGARPHVATPRCHENKPSKSDAALVPAETSTFRPSAEGRNVEVSAGTRAASDFDGLFSWQRGVATCGRAPWRSAAIALVLLLAAAMEIGRASCR